MSHASFPQFGDFFPRLRRGHGRGLDRRSTPERVYRTTRCAVSSCVLNGGREAHEARDQNIDDWKAERGL